jgi:hypothetical protein
MPSIIDAAECDKEIAELQSRTHAGMMSGFSAIVARAQARGELGPNFDVSDLTAAIAGPLFYRRFAASSKGPLAGIPAATARSSVSLGLWLAARPGPGRNAEGIKRRPCRLR